MMHDRARRMLEDPDAYFAEARKEARAMVERDLQLDRERARQRRRESMTRAYLLAVLERAVKTGAQSALLVFGADQVNALNANWADVGGFALGGFVLSVLTSAATSGFGGKGPSATTETLATERAIP